MSAELQATVRRVRDRVAALVASDGLDAHQVAANLAPVRPEPR